MKEIDSSAEISENRSGFSGPLGMLLAKAAETVAGIDFLHPRKPVVKPDRTKAKMGIAAAGLVLASAVAYGNLQMHLSDLEEQIVSKRTEISEIEGDLKKGEPVLKSAAVIGEWDQRNINWLDQMQELNGILPGTGLIYLKTYDFDTTISSGDVLAKIKAIGYAHSRIQVRDFYQDLSDQQYTVQRRTIPNITTDPEYPSSFQTEFQMLLGHSKKKANAKKSNSAKAKAETKTAKNPPSGKPAV
jgi:hypothetical protein